MDLKDLLKTVKLDWNNIYIDRDHTDRLEDVKCFDINPEDFLEFSKKDIESKDIRGNVNALSNSKRAIDCQIAKILFCFGINKDKWDLPNFPPKRELLEELGIVSPNIIRRIVAKRNYLEHEYKNPDETSVLDAIDVASLFIEASNKKLDVWVRFSIMDKEYDSWDFDNHLDIFFEPFKGVFKVIGYYNGEKIGETIIENLNKEEYKVFLRLAVSSQIGKIETDLIQPLNSLIK